MWARPNDRKLQSLDRLNPTVLSPIAAETPTTRQQLGVSNVGLAARA